MQDVIMMWNLYGSPNFEHDSIRYVLTAKAWYTKSTEHYIY